MEADRTLDSVRYLKADLRRLQWCFDDICYRDKETLIRTDYGRRAGWDVRLKGERVCTLNYEARSDMFWDLYAIADPEPAFDVHNDEFWKAKSLRFACRANPQFEALYATCRWSEEKQRILARGLYLPIKLSWVDRIVLVVRRCLANSSPTIDNVK